MLKDRPPIQSSMGFVCLDELLPQDHLLRKVDKAIDVGFIHDLVKELYCSDNGRPALDPRPLVNLLLPGYLFGVRRERQLIRELEVNAAYPWFLGLGLSDKVPDAKERHGYRYARYPGLDRVQGQWLPAAAAQNINKDGLDGDLGIIRLFFALNSARWNLVEPI